MWNQVCSQSADGMTSRRAVMSKKAALQILPCAVSQLLSACQVGKNTFAICDCKLNQVSVVGIVRGFAHFKTSVLFSVDDMTGPPLNVKQWFNAEDCALMTFASPGTYVKVIGSTYYFSGQRSLLATKIRCITDLNEITSHMLEVVHAHMRLHRKVFDVNMNTTLASPSGRCGLSTIQIEVLNVIRKFSDRDVGISFHELQTQLDNLSQSDIRSSLALLINEGHAFFTMDEHHFKSAEP